MDKSEAKAGMPVVCQGKRGKVSRGQVVRIIRKGDQDLIVVREGDGQDRTYHPSRVSSDAPRHLGDAFMIGDG